MKIPPKSAEEHKFTSTGIKFWRHPEQMNNYKNSLIKIKKLRELFYMEDQTN